MTTETIADADTGIGAGPGGDGQLGNRGGSRRLFLDDVRGKGGTAEGEEPERDGQGPCEFEIGLHLF